MSAVIRRLTFLCISVVALGCLTATAAGKTVKNASLAAIDVSGPTIVVPLARSDPTTVLRMGHIGLVVRNRSRSSRRLRIRYVPSGDAGAFTLRGTASSPRAIGRGELLSPNGLAVPVAGGDVVRLDVDVDARGKATPDDLRGRLLIVPERLMGRRVAGAPLTLLLRGVRVEEHGMAWSPKSLIVPIDLHEIEWAIPPRYVAQKAGSILVDVRGTGAAALAARDDEMEVLLYRDGDREAVRFAVRAEEVGENTTRLTFRASVSGGRATFEKPGRYAGSFALGPGSAAPRIEIAAEVRWWWGWAVLAVMVGVFFGRMVPSMLATQRVRRQGRDAVRDAIARYGLLRRGHRSPASRSLDQDISPDRWTLHGLRVRPRDHAARILRDLEEAHEAKLQEHVDEAVKLREKIRSWAAVERPARDLQKRCERTMPLGRDNCSFATTRAHREAETLLQTLRDPTSGPRQEAQQADRLVYVVVEQNELLRLAQEVWIHQGHDATVEALDRIWGTRRDPEKRAPRVATDLRAALTEAARHDQAPPEERQRGGARTEMLWERLVRTRRRRNERSGSWVSRGLSTLRQPIPGAIRWLVERRRGWLTAAEGLSRLATLAVPALVYVLTLYTDTWGSELDVVSALAVGFGGKLAIDLGASGLRARAADDEPSHGGGDDAGVGRSRSPQSPGVGSSN